MQHGSLAAVLMPEGWPDVAYVPAADRCHVCWAAKASHCSLDHPTVHSCGLAPRWLAKSHAYHGNPKRRPCPREPPLTTRTATWAGCIDFVWVTRGSFAVASALALPYSDGGRPPVGPGPLPPGAEGQGPGVAAGGVAWRDPLKDIEFVAIPDQRYPSDHLAVGGQVVLL